MLASFQRPVHGDISIVVTWGHFYCGLTRKITHCQNTMEPAKDRDVRQWPGPFRCPRWQGACNQGIDEGSGSPASSRLRGGNGCKDSSASKAVTGPRPRGAVVVMEPVDGLMRIHHKRLHTRCLECFPKPTIIGHQHALTVYWRRNAPVEPRAGGAPAKTKPIVNKRGRRKVIAVVAFVLAVF
jgi:hypothetical protein